MPRFLHAALFVLASSTLLAADPPAEAAKAKPYPLDTCVVTGEKLDAMGTPVVLVKDGQEVKLCCKGCLKDFNKDAAKYLAKIAEAQKAKEAAKP